MEWPSKEFILLVLTALLQLCHTRLVQGSIEGDDGYPIHTNRGFKGSEWE
jgi:hypothetical protein